MSKLSLEGLAEIDGFIAAALIDSESGLALALMGSPAASGDIDLELAAAATTEVIRAERKTSKALGSKTPIEDILVTLGDQYQLMRPLVRNEYLFLCVLLDRHKANLAMARHTLKVFETELDFS